MWGTPSCNWVKYLNRNRPVLFWWTDHVNTKIQSNRFSSFYVCTFLTAKHTSYTMMIFDQVKLILVVKAKTMSSYLRTLCVDVHLIISQRQRVKRAHCFVDPKAYNIIINITKKLLTICLAPEVFWNAFVHNYVLNWHLLSTLREITK